MSNTSRKYTADVIIVGGGLAGIVTAFELLDLNKKVLILERDTADKLGGLAKDSFGGIMMVDTPLQRKNGIKDSPELALSDWHSYAQFDQDAIWPKQWAELYVNRSRDLIHDWLAKRKVTFLPVVNWPERGLYKPGNSVPRWHIAWGTGYGLIESILKHLDAHPNRKNLDIQFNHQVNNLEYTDGVVTGCSGVLEGSDTSFTAQAQALVAAAGGMCGGDLSKVRKHWYKHWGNPPARLLNGSHPYADGKIHDCIEAIGGNITHLDKQWHYAAGIAYPKADMENKGLSLVPPRSALWMNALGQRIMGPLPLVGYTDTRYLVEQVLRQPGQYSWQIMNWKIAIKELAVSGSEHMKAFRYKNKFKLVKDVLFGNTELVKRLIEESEDFVVADTMDELVRKMNSLDNEYMVDGETLKSEIRAYDDHILRGKSLHNDDQLRRIANFRTYRGDRIRMCNFQRIDDPKARPLIAVRQFILSRKSLGGAQTDLACRVLSKKGDVIPGLFSVGENAGFGGGGIHGQGSLEGTFLGSCVLMGRIAAHAICNRTL
ncbi:MAG: FAD-binding dehydrogenase [Proteobacteria bacterium]|nr:FAD-binding dehydrogenase [Pseudomonadota bacterium]